MLKIPRADTPAGSAMKSIAAVQQVLQASVSSGLAAELQGGRSEGVAGLRNAGTCSLKAAAIEGALRVAAVEAPNAVWMAETIDSTCARLVSLGQKVLHSSFASRLAIACRQSHRGQPL